MSKAADEAKKKVRELRVFLGQARGRPLSQRELAKLVGSSSGLVAAWEQGRVSAESYVKLASVAPVQLARWFLKRAGLPESKLRQFAHAEGKAAEAGDETVPYEVGRAAANILFSPGDLVLLDHSHKSAKNLARFWNRLVLLEFPPSSFPLARQPQTEEDPRRPRVEIRIPSTVEEVAEDAREFWPQGPEFGLLTAQTAPLGFVAVFRPLDYLSRPEHHFAFALGRDRIVVGCWIVEALLDPESPKDRREVLKREQDQALANMKLFQEVGLRGRVVGWQVRAKEKSK